MIICLKTYFSDEDRTTSNQIWDSNQLKKPQDQVLDQIYFSDDDRIKSDDQLWDFNPNPQDFQGSSEDSQRVKKYDSDFDFNEYDFYDGHDMKYQVKSFVDRLFETDCAQAINTRSAFDFHH